MAKEIRLPKPKEKGNQSVEEALNQRRSVRDYRRGPLSLDQIAQLLWAACGKNLYRRTAPSAGATYPLETYLIAGEVQGLEPGIFRYNPINHSLHRTKERDIRDRLTRAALGQRMIEKAPISILLAANYSRTTGHYGPRGTRYVHMEVGHVGQNIALQANALGLGSVMIGAFEDKLVKDILEIEEEPLYIIPIGKI